MKKMLWLLLVVLIIAVVLVAVMYVQRGNMTDQIQQLESDKTDLNRQLTEFTTIVEEAEGKIHAAEEALSVMTTERDTLQTNAANATAQLTSGLRSVQEALTALNGGKEVDIAQQLAAELSETKEALAAAEADASAMEQELAIAQANMSTLAQERDQLLAALENAKVSEAKVLIQNAQGETVLEAADISELKLDDLEAGEYTVTVIVMNAAGEEAARYAFPYAVNAAQEEPAEPVAEETAAPAEEAGNAPAKKETAAQEPAAEEEAEAPVVEETPAGETQEIPEAA